MTVVMCCRYGFLNNLTLGGPTPIGARKAPLSEKYLSMMQEVALNEQVNIEYLHLLISVHVKVLLNSAWFVVMTFLQYMMSLVTAFSPF